MVKLSECDMKVNLDFPQRHEATWVSGETCSHRYTKRAFEGGAYWACKHCHYIPSPDELNQSSEHKTYLALQRDAVVMSRLATLEEAQKMSADELDAVCDAISAVLESSDKPTSSLNYTIKLEFDAAFVKGLAIGVTRSFGEFLTSRATELRAKANAANIFDGKRVELLCAANEMDRAAKDFAAKVTEANE